MAQPIKRGGIYWLRKKVPDDLRPLVGKTEEKFSLRTRDPAEARILFTKAHAEIEERWARLRNGRLSLTHKQAYAIAGEIYRERVKKFEDEPERANPYDLTLESLVNPANIKVSYAGADVEATKRIHQKMLARAAHPKEIDEYLQRHGLLLDDESRERLRKAVVESKHHANEQLRRYLHGNYLADPLSNRYPKLDLPATKSTDKESTGEVVTLSEAISEWVKEKSRKDGEWVKGSAASYELWTRRFLELVGDKPLADYGKADARRFKGAIMALPPNFLQKETFKKLDFTRAVEKAQTSDVERMSDRNVNKILNFVKAFWNWALGQYDNVPPNPFDKMTLKVKTKARDERDAFTLDQLQTIFDAPLFTGCKSSKSWLVAGDHIPFDQGIYWIPLIGLFTGARSGEIIQLACSDVRLEGEVLYLNITDEGVDQNLKTDTSFRTVPVHPFLKKLGFERFVAEQQKRGERLFPDFQKVGGYYSTGYSPRFKRFLENAGAKTPKTSFHSFRHSFKDACLNSRIPVEFANALQGHSHGGMADRYGTGLLRVKLLNEEMEKLQYDGLDFSKLLAARRDLQRPNQGDDA